MGAICEYHGAECQVALSGRINIDSSPGLRALLLQRLQSASCQILTVDSYEVVYVDTSGLAVLVEVLKAARAQGKKFHLSRLRERPRYLLEATRLLHLFDESPQCAYPALNASAARLCVTLSMWAASLFSSGTASAH